jgi:alpha-beta hydrolase superfamily lysophospholipase
MAYKGGRLELLVPHMLRGQLLRPGFVRLSLRLGAARQMPPWAKLLFINSGVSPEELDTVLGRIKSLGSWVEEWQALGREHETRGQDAQALGDLAQAASEFLAASAAYNFAQHVVFLDVNHKRVLHESCVRAYAMAAPLFDPPARLFEVPFRRRLMRGYLRVPRNHAGGAAGRRGVPVIVMFNGTNAVKEELHWWGEALLREGFAVIAFDGPGMGHSFHRLSMVAEPRPVGEAIMNEIESHPELDIGAVGMLGLSLGGYIAIRMAAHDPRIRAVAAVSPPYALDVYWNITLAGMRRELAALYGIDEREMGAQIERITLAGVIDTLRCPLMLTAGGHDHLTPGREAWRIFEDARCEREMVFYPRGGHECFNVLADVRPRMAGWLARQIGRHHGVDRVRPWAPAGNLYDDGDGHDPARTAAEAVDADFADALSGEATRPVWNRMESPGVPVRWRWPWTHHPGEPIEIVTRKEPGEFGPGPGLAAPPKRSSDALAY